MRSSERRVGLAATVEEVASAQQSGPFEPQLLTAAQLAQNGDRTPLHPYGWPPALTIDCFPPGAIHENVTMPTPAIPHAGTRNSWGKKIQRTDPEPKPFDTLAPEKCHTY